MAGRNATAWSRSEEENLQSWLAQHQGLSWKERSKEYFRQYQIYRTDESLRGKLNELRRRRRLTGNLSRVLIERARVVARRGSSVRRWTVSSGLPPPLPTIVLRVPDLKVKRVLERVRRRRSLSYYFSQQSCRLGLIILWSKDKVTDIYKASYRYQSFTVSGPNLSHGSGEWYIGALLRIEYMIEGH